MSVKFSVVRITGEGEQINAEVTVPDNIAKNGDIHEYLTRSVYGPLDTRLRESSRRLLDAMGFEKSLPPETRVPVMTLAKQVLDMIYGRAAMAPVPREVIEADQANIAREQAKMAGNVVDGPWAKSTAVDPDVEPS